MWHPHRLQVSATAALLASASTSSALSAGAWELSATWNSNSTSCAPSRTLHWQHRPAKQHLTLTLERHLEPQDDWGQAAAMALYRPTSGLGVDT